MCTCICLMGEKTMFGRNMDIHYSFNERILYIQNGSKIALKKQKDLVLNYSILGHFQKKMSVLYIALSKIT